MIPQFDKGVEVCKLADLQSTREYVLGRGGLPKNLPKIHFRVLDDVQSILAEENVKYNEPVVYIHESQSSKLVTRDDPKGQNLPLSEYLIQRVHARYLLGDFVNLFGDQIAPSVTMVYTEKRVGIAFGLHTSLCYNLAIFGDSVFYTDTTEYAAILNSLRQWMRNLQQKWESILRVANELGAVVVPESKQYELLGHFAFDAVRQNEKSAGGFDLNQTEVTGMIRVIEGLKNKRMNGREVNGWDLLQAGTAQLNPKTTDFNRLLPANNKFAARITEYLQIPIAVEQATTGS